MKQTWKDKTALVTGASSGLGIDFATILAEGGCDLILTARREERLRELADRLAAEHGVRCEVIPLDLAQPGAPQALADEVDARGLSVDVLINNAGYGIYGEFLGIEWERDRAMLELDVMSLVHLTKIYGRKMAERGEGRILLIASIGGFQPSPMLAAYSAGKAFVLSFGEALNYELKSKGVAVTVLSPGATETEFVEVAGNPEVKPIQKAMFMKSRPVAAIGLRALAKGRSSVVAGMRNASLMWLWRFSPRSWMAPIAAKAVK